MLQELVERALTTLVSSAPATSVTAGPGRRSREGRELDADLIVIGFQGQSHNRTGKIGSVADRVVRYADRPVLTA